MDIVRTWAICRKELIHIWRDPASLIQVILIPVVLLLINGYALNFDLKAIPLAVYNQDGSRVSYGLVRRFEASRYFQLQQQVSDYRTIAGLLDRRRIMAAIVIPYDFSRRLKAGEPVRYQLLVDGTAPELIRDILETEIIFLEQRHNNGIKLFSVAGALAPAFGFLGTLIGLIAMLVKMSDPETLGPAMAVALVTTLYGVILSNMVFIPLGEKLKARNEEEIKAKEMIIEGIMSIQSGDNPRIVADKLNTFLPPRSRSEKEGKPGGKGESKGGSKGGGADKAAKKGEKKGKEELKEAV